MSILERGFAPGSVWSLWDMYELQLSKFMEAYSALVKQGQFLLTITTVVNDLPVDHALRSLDREALFRHAQKHVQLLCAECIRLNLSTSHIAAQRILDRYVEIMNLPEGSDATISIKLWNDDLSYFDRVLRDELSAKLFVTINHNRKSQYDKNVDWFGDSVSDNFPDSIFDIAEAGKSIALGRYTACVFHLMRAAEAAVRILADKLDATVKNAHGEYLPWGTLISNIKTKIDAMPKGDKKDDWYKVHSLLHSCNRAYRTKTAHPADKYTEEEADAAMHATRSFMREFCAVLRG